jgi:hypothetical protein
MFRIILIKTWLLASVGAALAVVAGAHGVMASGGWTYVATAPGQAQIGSWTTPTATSLPGVLAATVVLDPDSLYGSTQHGGDTADSLSDGVALDSGLGGPSGVETLTGGVPPDCPGGGSNPDSVTAHIALPRGYSASSIDVSTIRLCTGSSPCGTNGLTVEGDGDVKGGRSLDVAFDTDDVLGLMANSSSAKLTVSGVVATDAGNRVFAGNDTVKVQGSWRNDLLGADILIADPATETPTPTATIAAAPTSTAAIPSSTPTATPTAEATEAATPNPTETAVPSSTLAAVHTAAPAVAPTDTPTATLTDAPTSAPTTTPSATSTPTAVASATPTLVPTATWTATAVPSPTPVPPTATTAPTATPPPTATKAPTKTP